jgi:UDP-N-acetylglucosamine--N-acetylmuramyl-(pentapeptide) pyrophosphoryl-undecaprenol N-acetylglucosamine transferase
MRVLFTGGGSGGHFYPIIAIAQELNKLAEKQHLVDFELFFMSDDPYSERILFENGITFLKVNTGKARRYFSVLNILDFFKTIFATTYALFRVFMLYPDVVVGKGGYASFPALFAARLLRIPVIIHESDSVPGKVNKWAAKFAEKIAISYPEAAEHLPKEKVALTGNPIRNDILIPMKEGAYELLKLEEGVPVIFVLGGSLGAKIINEAMLQAAPDIIEKYQVIHQVGKKNLKEMQDLMQVVIGYKENKERYKMFGYLDNQAMKMSGGVADLIISRAGSTIFEIAAWGVPSIIIPISNSNGDHQRKNAYSYARAGAADVIEEKNLTPHLLISEITRLVEDKQKREEMTHAAKEFSEPDAAAKIAEQVMNILIKHEKQA